VNLLLAFLQEEERRRNADKNSNRMSL